MKISELSKKELEEVILDNDCIYQMLNSLNVNSRGSGAYKTFKNHCKRLGVEIPKSKNRGADGIGNKQPLKEVLVEKSTYQNISRLKKRLVSENLIEYKCDGCDNEGKWMGNPMVLQLDHINGISDDHRIENLRLLCPNCHSQTETYGGKRFKKNYYCECGKEKDKYSKLCNTCDKFNKRKVERPPYEQLIKEIEEFGYSATGRKYGVSDNTIRKWEKL